LKAGRQANPLGAECVIRQDDAPPATQADIVSPPPRQSIVDLMLLPRNASADKPPLAYIWGKANIFPLFRLFVFRLFSLGFRV
jgi:hypothetical protein